MDDENVVVEEENKSKERKIFIVRAILWSIFACIIPVAFIGWRYDLFTKAGALQLSGWGIIAIIIIFVFLYVIVKYIRAGFLEWSMTKQIINGIVRVLLPLGLLLAICVSLRNSLDIFIQALGCVLLSETIAIPLNPFPEWVWNKSKGRFESTVDFVADRFYNKNKESKENGKGE